MTYAAVGKNIDKALDCTRARTPTGRAILAQLARHANKDLLSWPSQELLARRAGIEVRQVRTYLRELEDLGEIEPVKKGGNKPTVYRVTILDDEVLDRQLDAAPNAEKDRQCTTGPKTRWTGSVASLDRQHTAYEVIEEGITQPSSVLTNGEDGIFA